MGTSPLPGISSSAAALLMIHLRNPSLCQSLEVPFSAFAIGLSYFSPVVIISICICMLQLQDTNGAIDYV